MRLRFLAETGSTNADLLADPTAIEGDWLVADRQTAGRGRQGRRWEGLDGNFFGSTLVVLGPADPPPPTLSFAAGLALIDAVEAAAPGRPLRLKWPNDLLLADGKLAGILLERAGNRIVLGFGVNLAVAPAIAGRTTASLDRAMAPRAFAPLLAAAVDRMVGAWRTAASESLLSAWEQRAHPRGTKLQVHAGDGVPIRGTFDGLESDGALRLRTPDGACTVIRAGDVDLIVPAGGAG